MGTARRRNRIVKETENSRELDRSVDPLAPSSPLFLLPPTHHLVSGPPSSTAPSFDKLSLLIGRPFADFGAGSGPSPSDGGFLGFCWNSPLHFGFFLELDGFGSFSRCRLAQRRELSLIAHCCSFSPCKDLICT